MCNEKLYEVIDLYFKNGQNKMVVENNIIEIMSYDGFFFDFKIINDNKTERFYFPYAN